MRTAVGQAHYTQHGVRFAAVLPSVKRSRRSAVRSVGVGVQVHNVVLIVLSASMAASALYWAREGGYNFWGNAYKPSEREMGLTIYVFYMSKFYEFFDTVRRPMPARTRALDWVPMPAVSPAAGASGWCSCQETVRGIRVCAVAGINGRGCGSAAPHTLPSTAQIIMLLKGKWQQISLLHVYHHASISFIW